VKRKIGLAALTVLELSPQEQISVAAQAGYDFVGLRLIPVAGQPHHHAVDVPAIQKRLAATGMKVFDVEVFRLDAETDVGDYEPMLAIAARLGASDLLVHGADPERSRLADNWGRLCELADRYGLAANMEPMPWVEISTIAKANRTLQLAPRDNAAVLPDAIHFFREANRLEDLATTKMRYVQFCDARREKPASMEEIRRQAREDRLMPGEGELDLAGLLAALPPDLPLCLEIPYAKPMPPLERARLALAKTRSLLLGKK
jgi:sugar phosphate isomerase/epimerase